MNRIVKIMLIVTIFNLLLMSMGSVAGDFYKPVGTDTVTDIFTVNNLDHTGIDLSLTTSGVDSQNMTRVDANITVDDAFVPEYNETYTDDFTLTDYSTSNFIGGSKNATQSDADINVTDMVSHPNVTYSSQSDFDNGTYYSTHVVDGILSLTDGNDTGYWLSDWSNITNSGFTIKRTLDNWNIDSSGDVSVQIRENETDSFTDIQSDVTYNQFQLNVSMVAGETDYTLEETLTDATEPILSVSWHPDGTYLASGSSDDDVRIYDTSTWNLEETLTDATSTVKEVSWHPDGTYLASGSLNNDVYIYDTSTWNLEETLTDATSHVRSVSWHPDGTYLASGSSDTDVYIYDTSTWNLEETLTDAGNYVYSVSWHPDGTYLASGSSDDDVRIYDTSTWNLEETLTDSTSTVFSVSWHPDGTYLASGSGTNDVYIYDTSTWNLEETLTDATGNVVSVSWHPDGTYLASGSWDDDVRIYDTSTWNLEETLTDATSQVRSVSWHPDGTYLASGSIDDNVYIYIVPTGASYLSSVDISFYDSTDFYVEYMSDGSVVHTSDIFHAYDKPSKELVVVGHSGLHQGIRVVHTSNGSSTFDVSLSAFYERENLSSITLNAHLSRGSDVITSITQTINVGEYENLTFTGFNFTGLDTFTIETDTVDNTANLTVEVHQIITLYEYAEASSDMFNLITNLGFWALIISTLLAVGLAKFTTSRTAPIFVFVIMVAVFSLVGWLPIYLLGILGFSLGAWYIHYATEKDVI